VGKVANEIAAISGVEMGEDIPQNLDPQLQNSTHSNKDEAARIAATNKEKYKERNNTPIKNFLKAISNIFIPLAPAFVATGLLAGITAVISNLMAAGYVSGEGWSQFNLILNVIKNGVFSYMAIFVGINSAREFRASPSLGGLIGGATLLTGMKPEFPIMNYFTGEPLIAGQGGIIGVVLAVWILAWIEKKLHKIIPNSIDLIVTSFLSVLITGLLTIFLIMPFAGFVASYLLIAVNWILAVGGALSGFALGGIWLVMVMLGLHHIMTPIHMELINQTGVTILLPILAMGGAVIGYFGNVGAITIGASGLEMLLLIADGKWWIYLLGLLTAYLFGFGITYLFGVPKEARQPKEA
jgi:PTS system sucrose-specific IIC component